RLALELVFYFIVLADDDRHEITGERAIHFPMEGFGLVSGITLNADQAAVRNHLILFVDGREQFAGCLVVGIIVAGEPVMIGSRFALRPNLIRTRRIGFGRRNKRQALLWCSFISNGNRNVLPGGISLIERDVQLLVIGIPEREFCAARDLD